MRSFKAYGAVHLDKYTHTRVATTTTSSLVPLCRQAPHCHPGPRPSLYQKVSNTSEFPEDQLSTAAPPQQYPNKNEKSEFLPTNKK